MLILVPLPIEIYVDLFFAFSDAVSYFCKSSNCIFSFQFKENVEHIS
jgi:hypothetical protein